MRQTGPRTLLPALPASECASPESSAAAAAGCAADDAESGGGGGPPLPPPSRAARSAWLRVRRFRQPRLRPEGPRRGAPPAGPGASPSDAAPWQPEAPRELEAPPPSPAL